jgi:type III secretion translocon protein HrpF
MALASIPVNDRPGMAGYSGIAAPSTKDTPAAGHGVPGGGVSPEIASRINALMPGAAKEAIDGLGKTGFAPTAGTAAVAGFAGLASGGSAVAAGRASPMAGQNPRSRPAANDAAAAPAAASPGPAMPQPPQAFDSSPRTSSLVSAGGDTQRSPDQTEENDLDAERPPGAADAQAERTGVPAGGGGTSADKLEVLSVIQRHMDRLPNKMSAEDRQKLIDDPKTPPDLKQALTALRDDPELDAYCDTRGKGGKPDGCTSKKDWKALVDDPGLREYNARKSESYAKNYVPSDAERGADLRPRQIGAGDAAREFYLNSDSLPKRMDKKDLQDMVQGKAKGAGKLTPQMQAAAQFYLTHPAEWEKVRPKYSHGGDYLQDETLAQVNFTRSEQEAIDTVKKNKRSFFKDGSMTRESLTTLANGRGGSPEVRKAAQKLLDDKLLFGALDNGTTHHSSATSKANDGRIKEKDFDERLERLSPANRTRPPAPAGAHSPRTAEEADAVRDMAAGAADPASVKKTRGGGLMNFIGGIANAAHWVISNIYKPVVDAVTAVLPGPLKAIGGAISTGLNAADNLVANPIAKMAQGKSAKQAYKEGSKDFAKGIGETAASAVAPGAGKAAQVGAVKAAEAGAVKGAEAGAAKGAESAAAQSVTSGATKEGVKAGVKGAAKGVASTMVANSGSNANADAGPAKSAAKSQDILAASGLS